MLNVFVGYDKREHEAWEVCKYSILTHCPEATVTPIVQKELRSKGIYTRKDDNASTDFSLTRFLVPYLMHYKDYAVFMDCDMLVNTDIRELFELSDSKFAVQVVKHMHDPWTKEKMDAQKQTKYPKKNWSSLILFNCGHKKNKNLTPEVVSSVTPSFLHRLEWLSESDVGELPLTWNWLEGYYKVPSNGTIPNNIHWTEGGPWFDNYRNVDYADLWDKMYKEMSGK